MRLKNDDLFPANSIDGPEPEVIFGTDAVDGTLAPWYGAPLGTLYIRTTSGYVNVWQKFADSGLTTDWRNTMGGVAQTYELTLQSAATSTGNGTVAADVGGYGTLLVELSGTFVATVTFEGSQDGTNYYAILGSNMTTGAKATTATGTGVYQINFAGLSYFRARISAYTSGSITAEATFVASDAGSIITSAASVTVSSGNIAVTGEVTADQKAAITTGPTMTTLALTSTATALPSSALSGRRAVTVSHAGNGGRLWIGKSNVSIGNGLRIEAGMEPQTFPVNGGQIYGAGEPWILTDRLGTETYVLSLASLGSGVVLAGTYPTGQVYKSTDSGATWALVQRLGTETDVRSLASLGSGVVLAGTYPTGQVYKSTDSGATWALVQRLGTETRVLSLASLGSGVVLAGTSDTGQVYQSTDSGTLPTVIMEY